jgi:hypothetical protein
MAVRLISYDFLLEPSAATDYRLHENAIDPALGTLIAKALVEKDGALWRKLLSAEEDRWTDRTGAYRWFRSENVVCIEHFRRPHMSGQKAGRLRPIEHVVRTDSGVPHLGHLLACAAILAEAIEGGFVVDDRPLAGPTAALLTLRGVSTESTEPQTRTTRTSVSRQR